MHPFISNVNTKLQEYWKGLSKKQSAPSISEVANNPNIQKPVLFGALVLLVFLGVFGIWSFFAELESAALAQGRVTVDTNRKSIQHLEGGIVKKLHVREASQVKKGDVLIEIDSTQSTARLELLRDEANTLQALQARLIAERDINAAITFPKTLLSQAGNERVDKIMAAEKAIMASNRRTLKNEEEILGQRMNQLDEEIASLQSQVVSETRQLTLINEEIEAVAYLEKQRLIEKPRLLALQREAARLKGNQGEKIALISRTKQKIGETKTQLIHLVDGKQNEVLQQLRETQFQLVSVMEKMHAADDVLKRTMVRAPQDGTVVNLLAHTIGGVVGPGDLIMDIVPTGDELVIEANIDPNDIDVVRPGLLAKVKISAFKQRNSPSLDGVVEFVSADSLVNQQTGEQYYVARISVSKKQLARLGEVKLYPGMQATLMIISEKRTPMAYFISPIKDSFDKAFREQ